MAKYDFNLGFINDSSAKLAKYIALVKPALDPGSDLDQISRSSGAEQHLHTLKVERHRRITILTSLRFVTMLGSSLLLSC